MRIHQYPQLPLPRRQIDQIPVHYFPLRLTGKGQRPPRLRLIHPFYPEVLSDFHHQGQPLVVDSGIQGRGIVDGNHPPCPGCLQDQGIPLHNIAGRLAEGGEPDILLFKAVQNPAEGLQAEGLPSQGGGIDGAVVNAVEIRYQPSSPGIDLFQNGTQLRLTVGGENPPGPDPVNVLRAPPVDSAVKPVLRSRFDSPGSGGDVQIFCQGNRFLGTAPVGPAETDGGNPGQLLQESYPGIESVPAVASEGFAARSIWCTVWLATSCPRHARSRA